MKAHYTNIKRKGKELSPLQKLFRLVIILAAIGMTCAAIYSLTGFIRADNSTTPEIASPRTNLPPNLKQLSDPRVFIQAYLAANGTATLIERTQTIRASGHLITDEQKLPFTLIKKRPDKLLFTIDRNSHQITFGVSGDNVWQRIRAPQREDFFTQIEGTEAESWLDQRRFFDRIISTHFGEGRITEITVANWEGADCLQVAVKSDDGATVKMLVDPLTMYPIAQLQTLPNGKIQQTVFSDYRIVEGMPLPFTAIASVGGKVTSHIILDSASLNSGVLSRLFEIPEALMEESSAP